MGKRGIRLATKADGDDTTLSRFVKTPTVHARKPAAQKWLPGTRFAASVEGRTVFSKSVVQPGAAPLVSGHSNAKIGRDVRKGKLFRGYWIYALTLEERKTCPRSCAHWDDCYGNNMPFAKRRDHLDQAILMAGVERQLVKLLRLKPSILVRLHALGDFFSVEYVMEWHHLLAVYPRLAVFGYTAWPPDSPIGQAISTLKRAYGPRFAVRWSNGGEGKDCTVSIKDEMHVPEEAFVCPEQTGRTRACATCALCWESRKNVAFLIH